jgi:hypothetical protein
MNDDLTYFGVPAENIAAARRHPKDRRSQAIPTRKQVASLPPQELMPILIEWMETSLTEIIPSRGQIALVKEVLVTRPDAAQIAALIAMCTNFIEGA